MLNAITEVTNKSNDCFKSRECQEWLYVMIIKLIFQFKNLSLFQKAWNSFGIVLSMPKKHCSKLWRKCYWDLVESCKLYVEYCVTKRSREINPFWKFWRVEKFDDAQGFDRFSSKRKWHFPKSTACCQKSKSQWSSIHAFEKSFLSIQMYHWTKNEVFN